MTLVFSMVACGVYLLMARRWQILDLPNERSSHHQPTPHGGGLPLYLALLAGVWVAGASGWHAEPDYLLILGTALALVSIGMLDDLRGISLRLRFVLYAICCLVTVLLLQPFGPPVTWMPLLAALLAVLALLWLLNLYNFMDGIDGLASMQCILACAGASLLAWQRGADLAYLQFCLLLLAAQMGFLVWNWPPARLFMGDAGSIPSGYLLGGLAILGAARGYLPVACWLILLACFIVDASVTLLRRIVSGEPFTRPHRTHAYQRLSRHFGGHLPVVFILLALNAVWLFPLAWVAALFPKYSFLLVILAYLPLLAGMAKATKLG
jgi:Fuc2NAc and GlcNAc transferase